MTRSIGRLGAGVVAVAIVATLSGCAARADRGGFNCARRFGAGTVAGALTGAAIGGGLGGGIVATSGETERQAEDYAVGIGVGAVTGALIGGFFGHCAFDPLEEEAAPPPPPPPPAPAPRPAPARRRIVLRGVNFDFDKATIRADGRAVLEEAAQILKEEPSIDVSVDGHTDAMGTDEYNERLSQRRAAAVRDYLVRLGVSADRLRPRGFGESKPVATNETEDGRAENRRVELNVIGDGRAAPPRSRRPEASRDYREERGRYRENGNGNGN